MKNTVRKTAKMSVVSGLVLIFITSILSAQNNSLSNLPQYLFPAFDTGIIRLRDGGLSKALMNYNTLTGRMTFFHRNEVMDLVKPETVDTIFLGGSLFVPFSDTFNEVIYGGQTAFFIQHRSELVSDGKPGALGTTSQTTGVNSVSSYMNGDRTYNLKLPEKYRVSPYQVYWVRTDSTTIQKFLTLRQFLKLFPARERELREFIKRRDIELDERRKLLELAEFCNSSE
jgi:hypothetical protein